MLVGALATAEATASARSPTATRRAESPCAPRRAALAGDDRRALCGILLCGKRGVGGLLDSKSSRGSHLSERRGHHHNRRSGKRGSHVRREREAQVRVEAPSWKLVEHDGFDLLQQGLAVAAVRYALRDHLCSRVSTDLESKRTR